MGSITGKATELITFSRASLATVTASDGKIKWSPHNLLLASEQFDNSNWVLSQTLAFGSGSSSNATAAPNGTTTADLVVPNTTNSNAHAVYAVRTFDAVTYTFGAFAKAAGYSYLMLSLYDGAHKTSVFNLSTGAVAQTASGGTAAISSLGNGWYYCTVTLTVSAIGSGIMYLGAVNAGTWTYGTTSFAGDGTSGIYLWGAHLYRSDLGGMQANGQDAPFQYYNSSTPKNLLGYSDAISNAAWVAFNSGGPTSPTKGTTTGTRPNGTTGTIDTLTFPAVSGVQASGVYQNCGVTFLNTPVTFSVYARVSSGTGTLFLNLEDIVAQPSGGNFVAGSVNNLTTAWQRISLTGTRTSNTGNLSVAIGFDGRCSLSQSNSGSLTVELCSAQLSDSASLNPYVPNIGAAPSAAAYHGPRLDYDPATLAAKGLLVEEQRTNLLTYSDALDNAAWTKVASSVTANAAISPTGTSTADFFIPDVTVSTHSICNAAQSITSGVSYTISFYAKDNGYPYLRVFRGTAAAFPAAGTWFWNVSAGTFTGTLPSGWTNQSIISVGNGWYRCSVTVTAIATASDTLGIISTDNTGNTTYAGNGTSGLYLSGLQMEVGSFATSYIPTAASTVTRSADVASVGTSQFPYNTATGSLVVSGSKFGDATYSAIAVLRGASGTTDRNPDISLGTGPGGVAGPVRVDVVSGGISQASLGEFGTFVPGTVYKTGYAYATNDFVTVVNAGSANVDTSGTVPSNIAILDIGNRNTASNTFLNGYIRQITYIPRRLSSADLQARTA